jgi:hypothetical protein
MENDLSIRIYNDLVGCDVEALEKVGFEITAGAKTVKIVVGTDNVNIVLDYPLTVVKGEQRQEFNQFSYVSPLRLGKLYDLAVQIVNDEIKEGFDEDAWMRKYSEIKIEKHKPYPDVVYALKIDSSDIIRNLTFRFAVEGKDVASNVALSLGEDKIKGYCYSERDKNCYFNVDKEDCKGNWSSGNKFECTGLSDYTEWANATSCRGLRHGESKCVYDGISGNGFDPVGSRHFKQSCFDGEIFYTECADFRQELCTEPTIGRAVCKVNRWQDCASQKKLKIVLILL